MPDIMDATGAIVGSTAKVGGYGLLGSAVTAVGSAATGGAGWLGYGAVTVGASALTFAANKVWDFGGSQIGNYQTANAPKYAWKVGAAAGDALVKGAVGNNIVGQALGYVVGEVVGGEAANVVAGGAVADVASNAIQLGQAAFEKLQETKKTAEQEGPEEALNEAEKSLANKLGVNDVDAKTLAKKVVKKGAQRYIRNATTVALIDAAQNAAYAGAMTAGQGYLGGVVGSGAAAAVSYLPACMAGWKVGAWAAGGPAAAAATLAVDILAPVAVGYAAPYVADAASQAAEGVYGYWFGGQAEAPVTKKIEEIKITTVADELEQEVEAGELHTPTIKVEEEEEMDQQEEPVKDEAPTKEVEEPVKTRVPFRT